MARIIYTALCLFCMLSCQKGNKQNLSNAETIKCNVENYKDIDFNAVLDSVTYVKLETDTNCLINSIGKVVYYNDCYYILPVSKQALLVFDKAGHFLSKLDKQGGGPDEYVEINDFTFNEGDSTVAVLDLGQYKLISYSLKDWEQKSRTTVPVFVRDIISMQNNNYLGFNEQEGLYLLTEQGGRSTKWVDYDKRVDILPQNIGYLYPYGNEIGFFSPYDNVIYHLKNDTLSPAYKMEYNKTTPADYKMAYSKNVEDNPKDRKFDYRIVSHFENERWILQLLYHEETNKTNLMMYDKKKNECCMVGKVAGFQDGFAVDLTPCIMKDCIIYPINDLPATQLKEQLKKYPDHKLSPAFKKIINESKDDDNPILQILHLKK